MCACVCATYVVCCGVVWCTCVYIRMYVCICMYIYYVVCLVCVTECMYMCVCPYPQSPILPSKSHPLSKFLHNNSVDHLKYCTYCIVTVL